jgi:FMN phosphatase YigB (HAD superfamily)
MRERPTLVVFDLGGVIVRICRTWAEACVAAGLPVRGDESIMGEAAMAARRACAEAYQTGRIGCEEFFRQLSATTHGLYSPEEVRRIHDAWLLGEYDGVNALVRTLREGRAATAVLSNTNRAHWSRLAPPAHLPADEFPTPRLVDHLHASHLLGLSKPGPAIYEEFERRVRAAGWEGRAEQILFFDDLPENVDAARSRGWQAEAIDHAGDTAAQMAAHLGARGVL